MSSTSPACPASPDPSTQRDRARARGAEIPRGPDLPYPLPGRPSRPPRHIRVALALFRLTLLASSALALSTPRISRVLLASHIFRTPPSRSRPCAFTSSPASPTTPSRVLNLPPWPTARFAESPASLTSPTTSPAQCPRVALVRVNLIRVGSVSPVTPTSASLTSSPHLALDRVARVARLPHVALAHIARTTCRDLARKALVRRTHSRHSPQRPSLVPASSSSSRPLQPPWLTSPALPLSPDSPSTLI
ncbi:uncharacterized protein BXZ73DRAFT_104507 [Epithele typhae]|uniref:uncharacterized protein n=1 Tax=Epithele typhae TaxID=378194 RepID=UPI0020077987|nr:uncharacterized protein BXZ73DRAFT_104507 [Epithele typhae]KAH9921219.1 hypothetical protein BXZ73DRAFT_104507 [Epithele typhae]